MKENERSSVNSNIYGSGIRANKGKSSFRAGFVNLQGRTTNLQICPLTAVWS